MMLVIKARRKDPAADAALTESQRRVSLILRDAFATIRRQLEADEGKILDAIFHRPTAYVVQMVALEPLYEAQEAIAQELLADLLDGGSRAAKLIQPIRKFTKADIAFEFDRADAAAGAWARQHAAQLIRQVTEEQRAVVRDLVGMSMYGEMDARTVARNLKDVIGLTTQQAQWVVNHYNRQVAQFGDTAKAEASTARYSARINRYRRENIARTEIMMASNEGRRIAWQQAASDGFIPQMALKEWSTNLDGRECDECTEYNGEKVRWDSEFPWGDPPVHPSCRCSVLLTDDIPTDIQQMSDEELDAQIEALTERNPNPYGFPERPEWVGADPMDGPVAANPKFRSSRGYQDNCTNCVAAMEYRMRGYNVTASPRRQGGRTTAEIARQWKHPNGNLVGQHEMKKVRGKVELNAHLGELPDGARFVVQFLWGKGSVGHIIYGTKTGGKVRLFDPQNGKEVPTTGPYWEKVNPLIRVLRVDRLELTDPKEDLTW